MVSSRWRTLLISCEVGSHRRMHEGCGFERGQMAIVAKSAASCTSSRQALRIRLRQHDVGVIAEDRQACGDGRAVTCMTEA